VREATQRLDEAGHVAYIVGGSVRDFLLGREVKDYDIATSAMPEELCDLFPKAVTDGKVFGVIQVPTGSDPQFLEIATFRQDLVYQDHRHPTGIVFSNPMEDAYRRDFTINSLFFDPKTSRILDYTGGLEDLRQGVIRAIGNPSERFKEDALRLLRAVRFKTRLGFRLEPQTSDAIRARARLISKVSSERVRDELAWMWSCSRPDAALALLSELGLLSLVLPEVEALKGLPQIPAGRPKEDLWAHLLKTLRLLAEQNLHRSSTLSWMAVLHEIGKPIAFQLNERKNFNAHEIEGAKVVEKVTNRLKVSRDDSKKIAAMVSSHLKFKEVFQMREATLQRFIREDYFEELLAFHKADAMASDGNLAYYEFCLSRLDSLKKLPPLESYKLIDGKDLIQLGLFPGPGFSEILRVVEDLALEKKVTSKEGALEYIVKHFVK
jgi:poly(A) polymerase